MTDSKICLQGTQEWVLLDTVFKSIYRGYNSTYIRVDIFYCQKCLEQKDVKREESSREEPYWWRRK